MTAHDPHDSIAERRLEPADVFGATSLLGAIVMTIAGSWAGALFLTLTFVAFLVLRRLELPTTLEFAGAIAIVLSGWGNALWLFEHVGAYDKVVHFLTPMLVAPCLCFVLARSGIVPLPDGRRGLLGAGVFLVTVMIGFSLAGVWELVEASSDRWLGTGLAHGYAETIDDLYSSLLGSIAGGVAFAWATLRDDRVLMPATAASVADRRSD